MQKTGLNLAPGGNLAASDLRRHPEAGYRLLFEENPLPMWLLDPKTLKILAVNASVVRLFGHSRENFMELTLLDLCMTEQINKLLKHFQSPDSSSLDFFCCFKRQDGEAIPVEIASRPITFEGKAAILILIHDVTEQQSVQKRVSAFSTLGFRLSSARTQCEAAEIVVEVANELIGWDACSFDAYSAEKETVRSLVNIDTINGERKKLPPQIDGAPPTPRMMKSVREGGKLILSDKPRFSDDARPFGDVSRPSASIMIVPMRSAGRVIGILAIHSYKHNAYTEDDLNTLQSLADHCGGALERIMAEERILKMNLELEARVQMRTEQLEAANKELEAFCYSVSHDLRAPLRSINGFSRVLQESHLAALDGEGQECVRYISNAGERMSQLIEDLLRLSQVSRAEMSFEPVDLLGVAKRIFENLEASEPGRKVKFIAPQQIPAHGDPRLLEIALQNLLGNAWKFTGKAASPEVELGVMKYGSRPVYFVKDNGAGFDMAYASRLFGVFQRLHSGTEFPGTGVGLATVQRIVRRHGGRIWAKGKQGEGATFFFTLAHSSAHLCQD